MEAVPNASAIRRVRARRIRTREKRRQTVWSGTVVVACAISVACAAPSAA